jgi:hypothetical protein
VRFTLPIDDRIRPYVLVSPSLSFATLPTKVTWTGWTFRALGGVSIGIVGPLRLLLEFGFERARFAGDSPTSVSDFGNGPTLHGSVASSYLLGGTGVELAF